jgi:hypothetical protein
VFSDLGFTPREARRLLARADARIDEAKRLKKQGRKARARRGALTRSAL